MFLFVGIGKIGRIKTYPIWLIGISFIATILAITGCGSGEREGDNMMEAEVGSWGNDAAAKVRREPFIYTLTMTVAAAAVVGTPGALISDSDIVIRHDFIWTHLYVARSVANTARIIIRDLGASINFMPIRVPWTAFGGANGEVYQIPFPYRFREGTTIYVEADNLSASAVTLDVSLIGYIEPPQGLPRQISIPYFLEAVIENLADGAIGSTPTAIGDSPFEFTDMAARSYSPGDYSTGSLLFDLYVRDASADWSLMKERVNVERLMENAAVLPFKFFGSHVFREKSAIFTEVRNRVGSTRHFRVLYGGIQHLDQ